jgi:hypothetical protein
MIFFEKKLLTNFSFLNLEEILKYQILKFFLLKKKVIFMLFWWTFKGGDNCVDSIDHMSNFCIQEKCDLLVVDIDNLSVQKIWGWESK